MIFFRRRNARRAYRFFLRSSLRKYSAIILGASSSSVSTSLSTNSRVTVIFSSSMIFAFFGGGGGGGPIGLGSSGSVITGEFSSITSRVGDQTVSVDSVLVRLMSESESVFGVGARGGVLRRGVSERRGGVR